MQKKLSPISKRLVRHFAQGKPASIKNMWMFHISNCSREVIRNYEVIFGISLNRKIITWNDEFSSGYYTEYTHPNIELARKIAFENNIHF